jgi:DNA mismatch endonuclease (patch repair protein)
MSKRRAKRNPLTRSENMARIRSTDTSPEMTLRRALHAAGLRYRLHAPELPGRPDIVFRQSKMAIFVHGCFWHSHAECRRSNIPKSRQEYWGPKLERNVARDVRNRELLEATGWTVLTFWECETQDKIALAALVADVQRRIK